MAITLFSILKGLGIQNASDRSKQLALEVSDLATTGTKTTIVSSQTADRTITLPDSSAALVTADSIDTLTNKTIDGDDNTIQDLALSSLKTNLSDASKFLVRDISGIVVSDSKVVPTGIVVGTSDTQTLTGKTIDGDDNTVQDIALASLKAVPADANKLLVRNGSGVVVSSSVTLPSSNIVGISDVQTLTNKTIDGDDNTVQDLALTSLKTNITDASKFIVRDASGIPVSNTKVVPSGTVVGTSDTQVITAKDIDGGTASNTSRLTIPKNTKANLTALTRKQATLVYASDENKLYSDDGATLVEIGTAGGGGATVALDNLSGVALNASLIADTNDTYDLGSNAIEFRELWVKNIKHTDASTELTIASNQTIHLDPTISGGSGEIFVSGVRLRPDGAALMDLGSSGSQWNDFYCQTIKDASSQEVLNIDDRQLKSNTTVKLDWSATDISVNTRKIINLSNPTSAQDAATMASSSIIPSGVTGSRPGSPATGQMYLDTTLNKPIWYNGSNWIDATGTTV